MFLATFSGITGWMVFSVASYAIFMNLNIVAVAFSLGLADAKLLGCSSHKASSTYTARCFQKSLTRLE